MNYKRKEPGKNEIIEQTTGGNISDIKNEKNENVPLVLCFIVLAVYIALLILVITKIN